jgi:hypothetical protein
MSNTDEYLKLKKKADAAQKKADKAQGAYDQILKQLKDEFGCSSLEEAQLLLKKMKKKEKKIVKEFDEAMEAYTKECADNESD